MSSSKTAKLAANKISYVCLIYIEVHSDI